MFNAFLHGGRRLISTSWSWGESFCKLCMTQNVHIIVVKYRTYNCIACNTKSCDVACQKIFQGTEKHQGYQWMSCFTLPSKGVHLWKCVMQSERYKHHFLQFATFFTLMRRLLLPASVPNRIMCPKFCMKWKRRMETSLSGNGNGWGKRKWSSCLASWCVDPWFKCALLIPLITLS